MKKEAKAPARAGPTGAARARRMMRVVLVCYLFLGALYAIEIPWGAGPDETAHLRYVEYLAQHHRLPVFNRTEPGADYEFHQPPLYYLVVLPTYLMTPGDMAAKGHSVRFVTILLGLALLYLTYALARVLLPDRPWSAAAAAALIALLPMHLHLVASVSNDALTEVFFAAALVLVVYRLRAASDYHAGRTHTPPSLAGAAWLGAVIGLGVLTKSLAVMLLPVAWFALVLSARGRSGYEWRPMLRHLAVTTALALVIAGWWLVRNQVRYGDPLAQRAFLSAFQDRPSPHDVMANFLRKTGEELSPGEYLVYMVIPWTFASVFGVFGPIRGGAFAFYPVRVYVTLAFLCLAATVSFVRYLVSEKRADWANQAWIVSALLVAMLVAGFVRFNLSFFQAQARYLFPALPIVALAGCLGLEHLLRPGRGYWLCLATALGLGMLALAGLPLWILPQFRVP